VNPDVTNSITPFRRGGRSPRRRAPGRDSLLPVGPVKTSIQPFQPPRGRARRRDTDTPSTAVLVTFFLPMLDDLELVTDLAPMSIQHHPWVDALRLIRRHMVEGLAELGVERFGAASDAFDPDIHQVVWYEPAPDLREIRIDAVIRQGYRIGSQSLRSAQVAVVGPPAQA
jgi:molecular chaperone GrpE (heat shock protein)